MERMVLGAGRTASISLALIAIAACGGNVSVSPGSGGGGASSTTGAATGGAGATATSTNSTTSTSSTTTSGTAGAGGLPPLDCADDEGAIVSALAGHGVVAVHHGGAWTQNAYTIPYAGKVANYVDVYNRLGTFWIDPLTSPPEAHFATTYDGSSFNTYDVQSWSPEVTDPLAAVGGSMMLGSAAQDTSIAYFDADAFDWFSYGGPTPFRASSAVLVQQSWELLAVGIGPQLQLCDATSDGASWSPVHCRDDVTVATGGEIPVTRPRVVALPNGDVVVVYSTAAAARIAATVRHAGVWSAPEEIASDAIGIELAATATPGGDVIVAVVNTASQAAALRYRPGAGWSGPIPLDAGVEPARALGAAPGICGDDAWIAYGIGSPSGKIRVARVRGDKREVTTVGQLIETSAYEVAIATRRPALVGP